MNPLAVSVLAIAIAAAIGGAAVAFARSREAEPLRPWWQHSALWVGVSAVLVLVGVFVVPKLLGFTFLFIPFIWFGGIGRRTPPRPRSNPHDADTNP
jgi:hypothetical protein